MANIGFVGGGQMAEALLASLLRARAAAPREVHVCEIRAERRAQLAERHAVRTYPDAAPVLAAAEIVFLAVKPQDLDGVLADLAPRVGPQHLIVSIAAGRRLAYVESRLPQGRVARVMPNLAVRVGEGASVLCAGRGVTAADRQTLIGLLSCSGLARELPEQDFDAVTALSGSGPAFCAYFLQTMIEAAQRLGLPPADAAALATQTMLGTAALLARGGYTPAELIAAVSSPQGTTVAGRAVLETPLWRETVCRALEAAAARSRELSAG